MNNKSQETLRRVTQNDTSLTYNLRLAGTASSGAYDGDNSDDYSALGVAIANNTYLENLMAVLSNDLPLGVADREFYDGLKRNSSIHQLTLYCGNRNIAGGVAQEILKAYQENNGCLTVIRISNANLQRRGDRVIGDTLRCCRNLQRVELYSCNITDAQLLPIVDAIRGHSILEELDLLGNNIGNAGCDALATLLTDLNCSIRSWSRA